MHWWGATILLPAAGVLWPALLSAGGRAQGDPVVGGSPGPQEPPEPTLPAVRLLGVRVHALTFDQALAQVDRFLAQDRPRMVVTADASAVMRAQQDQEYREIVNRADLVTADGAGVILAARVLGLPLRARVSGCDLVPELCRLAAARGRGVYFLGGEPGVADRAAEVLAARCPGLRLAGSHHGYFNAEDESAVLAEIRQAQPGLLLVALGIPRQEKWIRRHLDQLGAAVCIGVGGSLDVISGRKRRAPRWMQRAGLEWLYRTLQEPSRLPRLAALPRLLVLACGERLRR